MMASQCILKTLTAGAEANYSSNNGKKFIRPVDLAAAISEVMIWITFEASPVKANTQPRAAFPAFCQTKAPFSSANATSHRLAC